MLEVRNRIGLCNLVRARVNVNVLGCVVSFLATAKWHADRHLPKHTVARSDHIPVSKRTHFFT